MFFLINDLCMSCIHVYRLIDWIYLVLGNMGMRLEFIVLVMLGTSLVCHCRDLGVMNPFAGKTLPGKKENTSLFHISPFR